MELIFGDDTKAAEIIFTKLQTSPAEKKVLFLVSGGSNINLAVNILDQLSENKNLTISLIDERFGPVGHENSNWQKLLNAGYNQAKFNSVAILKGDDISTSTENFNNFLNFYDGLIIALLGMGEDGHTAGILPQSTANESNEFAAYYRGPDFERITVAPKFFILIDHAFLVANGPAKKRQLQTFITENRDFFQQPVQLLKRCKQTTVISNQLDKGNE